MVNRKKNRGIRQKSVFFVNDLKIGEWEIKTKIRNDIDEKKTIIWNIQYIKQILIKFKLQI